MLRDHVSEQTNVSPWFAISEEISAPDLKYITDVCYVDWEIEILYNQSQN